MRSNVTNFLASNAVHQTSPSGRRSYYLVYVAPGGKLAGEEKFLEPGEPLGQVGKLIRARDVEELREEGRPDIPVPPPRKK